jgi:2-polyprenyl-3-methyl-5-hydroxy-6-metoxy-1,4-benzoquinol methylase
MSAARALAAPAVEEQKQFWDAWNTANRGGEIDGFARRQLAVAQEWMARAAPSSPAVVELGCGTGWLIGQLARSFPGRYLGIDLSESAVALARSRFPEVTFSCADASVAVPPGPFDVVITADTIAHIPDQRGFVRRIAAVVRPGGLLVLMTQNPFVWNRSSYLRPSASGQYRNWPGLRVLRRELAPYFRIRHLSSIVPGGDTGVLRLIHSRFVSGPCRRIMGEDRLRSAKERLMLGREMVVIATRR